MAPTTKVTAKEIYQLATTIWPRKDMPFEVKKIIRQAFRTLWRHYLILVLKNHTHADAMYWVRQQAESMKPE